MDAVIVALITGYLAFAIGKWRQGCCYWEMEGPHNLPSIWRNPMVRIGSWLVVATCSLVFVTAIAIPISEEINSLLGKFAWGVLLIARWYASGIAATFKITHAKT